MATNEAANTADDLEAIKVLKARYFRFVDTKQWGELRKLLTDDMQFELSDEDAATAKKMMGLADDESIAVGGDSFVAMGSQSLREATSVHQGFMPEITFTGPGLARGIWALHDYLEFPSDGPDRQGFHGYGHYEEEYRKEDGAWRISAMNLTRLRVDPL